MGIAQKKKVWDFREVALSQESHGTALRKLRTMGALFSLCPSPVLCDLR